MRGSASACGSARSSPPLESDWLSGLKARVPSIVALVAILGSVPPAEANGSAIYAAQMAATSDGLDVGTCHLFAGQEDSTWEVHCRVDSALEIPTVELGNPPYSRGSTERLRSEAPGVYEARIAAPLARQTHLLSTNALPIRLRRCDGDCFESQNDVEAEGVLRLADQTWSHYSLLSIDPPPLDSASPPPVGECDAVTTESLLGVSCIFDSDTLLVGADLQEGTSVDNVNEDEVLVSLFEGWQDPGHLTSLHEASSLVVSTVRSGRAFIALLEGPFTTGPAGVIGAPADPCHRTATQACLLSHRVAVAVDEDMASNEMVTLRSLRDAEALFTMQETAAQSLPHVDVLVEVGCDAGEILAVATAQGFPGADSYNVTVTVADASSDASDQLRLTEASHHATVRFGACP